MGLANINTNLAALKSYNTLTSVNRDLNIHQERISTGRKVNRASDDPAGYYIARIYEREVSVINRNLAHVANASAELQTQDSKMAQTVKLLQDIEDLVLQAKSELVTSAQKSAIKVEINQLILEIKDIVSGLKDISGVDVGAGLTVSVAKTYLTGLPSAGGLNLMSGENLTAGAIKIKVSTAEMISTSLSILSAAIKHMLQKEEKVGAYISRLEAKGDAYAVDVVNKKAQKSVTEDADLAEETLEVTKYQILQQSAIAMLAQANVAPQALLQLLG
jgi:flagellin